MADALLETIAHIPDGYTWLSTTLPRKSHQTHKLRKQWAGLLMSAFFPASFLHAMVLACVSEDGTPDNRGRLLYKWLVKNVYKSQPALLHKTWVELQEQKALLQQMEQHGERRTNTRRSS